jgi:DNA-binding NtrC family response regulator
MATLLVVDDDNNIRETLSDLLGTTHECHTADRAEQALAFLEFETYDVILTDLAMPGLSGRDLLAHVQKTHPTTPVIVVSETFGEAEGSTLREMGAFAYCAKPLRLEEIEDAVVRAIAARQPRSPSPNSEADAATASGGEFAE